MERTHAACARRRFGWSDDNEAARVIADSNMCEGRWAMGVLQHTAVFFSSIFSYFWVEGYDVRAQLWSGREWKFCVDQYYM